MLSKQLTYIVRGWLISICLSVSITASAQKTIDLFIWAGQSNAQGWTGDAEKYPEDKHGLDKGILLNWTFYNKESSNGKWIPMQAQKGRYPKGHFGPEISFARELKKDGHHPAIFKFTKGATGLSRDWKVPGKGGIYDDMVKALKLAIRKLKDQGYEVNIEGFIWIQGESDAGDVATANAYYDNLKTLINDLKINVLHTPELKIILGVDEQHKFVQERPIVAEAMKKLAVDDKNIVFTSMYGLQKADGTHLTPSGLIAHGERIFLAYHHALCGDLVTVEKNKIGSSFADKWEFVGVAVEEPGYTIWGSSPIMDNDGKVHLFVARWPGNTVEPGWRSHSEVAHYVGEGPEGPFTFSDIAVKGTGKETWDKYGAHNPTVHKVGDQYVLLYIGNDNPTRPSHPSNQKIGMATSKSLYGPWERIGEDGLLLDIPKNPGYWNHKASNGVNNPAFLQHPDGGFFLYFKSEKARMGLAVAENLEGPYVQMSFPVTTNESNIEDGYAFMYKGKFALLTTDNHGMIQSGGGLLWTSEDGIKFDQYEKGFHQINTYTDVDMEKVAVHYGPMGRDYAKFERPQVLLIDGKPAYLYVASGNNIYGGPYTVSYVLKFNE